MTGVFYVNRQEPQTAVSKKRPLTAIAYRISGNSRFYCNNTVITAAKGSVIYIPAGVDFRQKSIPEELIVIHLTCFEEMEDNTPMDAGTKSLFTVLMSMVAISWTASLLTLIRQMLLGYAFRIDENGIHDTATAIMILAFIFVVPIRRIPYNAIQQISEENGILTIRIDKSKIQVVPFLKPFVRKEYHFFSGFTKEKVENIKETLNDFMKL